MMNALPIRLVTMPDLKTIVGWFHARGMNKILPGDFPHVGMISDDLAAGFLVQTDTPIAFLDFFITNPSADRIRRGKALRLIAKTLVYEARRLQFRRLGFDTEVRTISQIGESLDFRSTGARELYMRTL